MKNISINIKDNNIIFSYIKNNKNKENLVNTNIISNNELIFSDVYINENLKMLNSFIKELSIQYKITSVYISKIELASIILNILEKATTIENITILEDTPITYNICENIINLKHLKNVNCYTIQPFMIELLDKNNITCETRGEILYLSSFTENNNLLRFSNIFYKTNIRITLPLSLEDLKDFEDFCKINKYLKIVHINTLIPKELEKLIKILTKYAKNNIKVIIHENINDEKTVNYLRDLNKNYKRKYHIYLSLEYTKEYLDKNIIRQTIVNTLRVCGLIISSLVVLVITYIGVSNYVALKDDEIIKNDLAKVIEDTNNSEIKEIIDQKNNDNLNETPNTSKDDFKYITNTKLATLLTVNDDVIGEIKVNNTNVDYPVVQAKDNDYYLKHNINKQKNKNGWIYMDYRNNSMNLDKNNIIYGHNMYYSGVMFGTLHKTTNKNWYTNPENQIITYNTLYENMKFRIFSIYRIPKTSDYLKVYFEDDLDFLDFINTITNRSIYNFNVPINSDAKIITLSTCSDNGTKRLVIHAVLIS